MGRAKNNEICASIASRTSSTTLDASTIDREFLSNAHKIITKWSNLANSKRVETSDQVSLNMAKARALKSLTNNPNAQRELILLSQGLKKISEENADASPKSVEGKNAGMAKALDSRAREMFILCHTGFVEDLIAKRVHMLKGEPNEEARQVLRQEAWTGINECIDTYDPEKKVNPLTQLRNGMRPMRRVTLAIAREGGEAGVRLKSDASNVGRDVNIAANQINSEGRQITVSEIAKMVDIDDHKVAEILPFAYGRAVRMDAKISDGESGGETTRGALIPDTRDTEEEYLALEQREMIQKAIDEIVSPYRRKIADLSFGKDSAEYKQKDFFNGVYVDEKGDMYSAEDGIINERGELGEKVIRKSQRELNAEFSSGSLKFEPGTPESRELAILARGGEFDPNAEFERYITKETGIPPTPGSIADAKRRAKDELSESPHLKPYSQVYRGVDELEQSEAARNRVCKVLQEKGALDANIPEEFLTTRVKKADAKTPLRKLAEEYDLVDSEGRVTI